MASGVRSALAEVVNNLHSLRREIKVLQDDKEALQRKADRLRYEVEDIDAALSRLAVHGCELINPQPVTRDDGTRYAFIHPRSAFGVLVELYERPRNLRAA